MPGIEISIEAMNTGDFRVITDTGPDIVIERKTLSDLASSIVDNRFVDQKIRMKAESGCKLMYIIESCNYRGRIAINTLRHAMLSTMLRDGFMVYFSSSIDGTIDALKYIISKKSEWDKRSAKPVNYTGVIKSVKKANMTPSICFNAQLQQIPGVSVGIAAVVCDRWNSMAEMVCELNQLSVACRRNILENLTVGPKRLGKAGTRIHDYLWNTVEPAVEVKPAVEVAVEVKPAVEPAVEVAVKKVAVKKVAVKKVAVKKVTLVLR